MTDYKATYSPDDNKIRLWGVPKELYPRVKAAGFRWAPRQRICIAPAWSPEAADMALDLAGEIGDEDTSLIDRAEVRAERFEAYSDKRESEATRALEAVQDHPAYVEGGQVCVGHHHARRAEREAQKIEAGMKRAVQLWERSQYWTQRAKGAIRHAKYKELPQVRARRIKTLEADQRKHQRTRDTFAALLELYTTNSGNEEGKHSLRRKMLESYHAGLSFDDSSALRDGKLSYEDALARAVAKCAATVAYSDRWISHLENRLTYEKVMLEDQGESELIAPKPRRELLPLCNYRAAEVLTPDPYNRGEMETLKQIEMTSADYAKIHTDYRGTRVVDRSHRVRVAMIRRPGAAHYITDRCCVFLTDSKVHKRPKPAPEPSFVERAQRIPEPRARVAPERTAFDALKDSLRQGVKAVTAPQLFVTPPELAARVIVEADIAPHHRVLEPSAGTGNLLRAIHTGQRVAVEVSAPLAATLASQFPEVSVRQADFLACNGDLGTFDRIVMNPPFANGQDIKHVQHALHMLKPGGRLVAIMSAGVMFRQDAEDFREMIEERGGSMEALPEDSFRESGTGTSTILVTLSV